MSRSRTGGDRLALLLTALALLWRGGLLLLPETALSQDNALYSLMARHIRAGEFPIFTWGQHYMGSLESVVGAGLFALLGERYHVMQLSPLLFFGAYLVLLHALARTLFGAVPARWALAYAAAAPFPLYVWSASPRGGYAETLCFGTAVLLLTLRILEREGGGVAEWSLLGLAAGIGFWTNFQIASYCLPAGLVLLSGLGRRVLHVRTLVGAGAFLLGSLPFWIYNIPRDFVSLRMGAVATQPLAVGAPIVFGQQLPEMLGLTGPYLACLPRLHDWWLALGGALYLVGVAVFVVSAIGALRSFLRGRSPSPGEGLPLLFALTLLTLASGSRFSLLHTSRYLLPLHTVAPLLGACLIARAGAGGWRRAATGAWAGLIVAQTLLLGVGTAANLPTLRQEERKMRDLIATLLDAGETRGVSDNGMTKRLTFLSGERLILALPVNEQYRPYETLVERSPRAFFLVRGGADRTGLMLDGRGVTYQRREFPPYRLLMAVHPPGERLEPLPAAGWRLAGEGAAGGWADGASGVGSAPPGREGETTIDLGAVRTPALARVVLEPGARLGVWEAWSSTDGESWTRVLDKRSRDPVFVSGSRVYGSGMFLRAELVLRPRPARHLKLRRRAGAPGGLGRVEEFFLYESRPAPVVDGPPPEALAYLRARGVAFTWADRRESAVVVAALGDGRASVPHHWMDGGPDRTGLVEARGVTAFLVRSSEAPAVRAALLPRVAEERDFGDYTVLVIDLPGGGPTGLRWTGFAPLFDGPAGRTLWQAADGG